mmetsp:Transcript_40736/g.96731  ORF Transcript_40736/g.96731 Transcript_40736/m.96731 type:complete len:807 (-) Transcript_40736:479-2899(-)
MFSSVLGSDTNTISKRKDTLSAGVNKTTLIWTVGKFRKFGSGECVSKIVKAGQSQQWRLSLYPRGFTSSDYVSFFITNVGLENGDGDKIKARVTVTVKMPEQNQNKKKKGGIMEAPAVTKTLDKAFSCAAHTFGFNKFAEADQIFSLKNGLIWDVPENDAAQAIDGKLSLQIEIHQFEVLNIDEPELQSEVTQQGWQRVEWVIKDVKGLIEKLGPGQVISSGDFRANGEWYIDLYPSSYRVDDGGWLSIFLHSSLRQADRGLLLKRRFRFGIKRQNRLPVAMSHLFPDADEDVFFPPSATISALFQRHARTAGKQRFLSHALLAKGRAPPAQSEKALSSDMRGALQREFVAGKLDKAGAITLVLDILVQDSEEGQVQQMLHMTPAFRNEIYHVCGVTGRRFGVLPVFGGAKGTPSPCYMCGRSIVAAMLTAGPLTRLPEFGYEVGRDEIMDVLLREAGAAAWIERPVQELKGWVKGAIEKNKALREMQQGVRVLQERVRAARAPFLCQGLDHVSDSDEDEEGGGGFRAPSLKTTRRERERMEQELALQREHVKRLRALRKEVEDAHFSKPVCSFCVEHCKAKAAMPSLDATLTSSAGRKDQASKAFAAGWMQKLAIADAAWEATGTPSRGGITASVSTLARGGFMCEPLELQRQCSGRLNQDNPWNADEERNTFCDVRFDRKGTLLARPPKKFHCHGTGKVFCAHCVRFKAKLPEHEKDPQNATLVPVSHPVFQAQQTAPGRIQPVSEKRAASEATKRKVVLGNGGDNGEDDRDSDDDDPRWAFVKGLLDQGKGLLEGNFKAAGAS